MDKIKVCFLSYPPGSPAVPQYLDLPPVVPGPSRNCASPIKAHSSSIDHLPSSTDFGSSHVGCAVLVMDAGQACD
jgi:hypothetical protein